MMIEANGAQVYVERRGQGGPGVLLLHGWGCDVSLWKPVMERLSGKVCVAAVDLPGHGRSGRPPVPWGPEEYARAVADVIRQLGMEGCDVIGHSNGGRVALYLAAAEPGLVRRLVLTGASGLRAEPTEAQKKRSAAYRRLRGISDALDRAKIFGPLPERMREALRQKYGSADYRALDAEMRATFNRLVTSDVTDTLPRVKAPALLIWGDADTETPLWMGRRMEELIPDAGLVVLEGGGHYAYLEKLPEFMRIVEHFLLGA